MLSKQFNLFFFLSILCLTACSGGGGGHDDSYSGAHDDSLLTFNGFGSDYKSKGLRVIYSAIDGSPIQIARDNKVLYSPFRYTFSNYINLAEGVYDLQVNLTNEPVLSFELNFSESKRQTLLLCSFGHQVIGMNLFNHENEKSGVAAIRVVHASFGAERVRAVIDGNEFLTEYCNTSPYYETSSNQVQVTVYRDVDGMPIFSQVVELESEKNYSVVIGGNLSEDYFTKILRD